MDHSNTEHELTMSRTAILAATAALMTFAKQIAFLLIEDNRYFFLWRTMDSIGVVADVMILGAALFAVAAISRKWSIAERIWNRVLTLMIVSGLITLLPNRLLPPMSLNAYRAWALVLVVTLVSLFWRRLPYMKVAGGLAVLLSPLMPILFFQLLPAATWSTSEESSSVQPRPTFTARPAKADAPPIFLFVFDEWSSKRTMEEGAFLAAYPHSGALGAQALSFNQAWSYSTRSYHSLPALIFQMDQRIQITPGVTRWTKDGQDVPTSTVPSLFALAQQHGYHTALQGFYL